MVSTLAGATKLLALASFVVLALPASAGLVPIVASQDWWPVYSPDGQALAFTRLSGNTMTLEVLDLRAHAVHRIAANRGQLSPSWSSGGGLAFSLGGQVHTSAADRTDKLSGCETVYR